MQIPDWSRPKVVALLIPLSCIVDIRCSVVSALLRRDYMRASPLSLLLLLSIKYKDKDKK